MGSKRQLDRQLTGQQGADAEAAWNNSKARGRALLGRIASALQVSTEVFYAETGQARRVDCRLSPAVVAELEAECVALIEAYKCILDPTERRRLLAIVQQSASTV